MITGPPHHVDAERPAAPGDQQEETLAVLRYACGADYDFSIRDCPPREFAGDVVLHRWTADPRDTGRIGGRATAWSARDLLMQILPHNRLRDLAWQALEEEYLSTQETEEQT